MRRLIAALVLTVAGVVAVLLYRSPPVRTAPTVAPLPPAPTPTATGSGSQAQTITGPVEKAYQPQMGYVFGDVQVVIAVRDGRIVSVKTPLAPPDGDTGGRGTQPVTLSITQFALPALKQEALRAQSAKIQSVSGATFTTKAFVRSLQAALSQVSR